MSEPTVDDLWRVYTCGMTGTTPAREVFAAGVNAARRAAKADPPIVPPPSTLTEAELDALIGVIRSHPPFEGDGDLLRKLREMRHGESLCTHCPKCPFFAQGGMRKVGSACPNCGTFLAKGLPPRPGKTVACGYCHHRAAVSNGSSCPNCNIPYPEKPATSMQWLKLRSAIHGAVEKLKGGWLSDSEVLRDALAEFEDQKPTAPSPVLMAAAQVLADLVRGGTTFTGATDLGDMLLSLLPRDQMENLLAHLGQEVDGDASKEREEHAVTKTSLRVTTAALRDVETTLDEVARLIGRIHYADGQPPTRASNATITKRVQELVEAEERAVVPRSVTIVGSLLYDMEQDNGATFKVGHASYTKLVSGVEKMLQAGCPFTPEQITQIASGEGRHIAKRFGRFNGWSDVNAVMDAIFEGADGPEDTNDDPEDDAPSSGK